MAQAQQESLEEFRLIQERTVENFYSKPKSYIKKALGSLKPRIDLSKILDENNQLEEDPNAIQDTINKYFKNIMRERNFDLENFPNWQDEYLPKPIDQTIYNQVLSPFDNNTIDEAIHTLPKKKSPGKSEISYDIIKLLKGKITTHLTSIFNQILTSSSIPHLWKQTSITLIPKKLLWSHKLNDTRPISLVDSTRKIFTGIINKRLSSTLKSNSILSEFNFAGLPGQSTLEPLTIVNSAIQAANVNNKEFWFASLDIAKAFDSVPIPAIKKSLERIKCPPQLISLLINLLMNREISINSPFGPTNPFVVNNGIEQGETISPITWVIFYDPLISKLSRCKKIQGYLAPNALAYMDDLALIADSKPKMENLLETANQFFQINDITCNKEKTKIINNIKVKRGSPRTINFENLPIQVLKPYESIKYLGVLISPRSLLKANRKAFSQIASQILDELNKRQWKGEIKQRICEWVIMGKFEYFLSITHLNKSLLNTIQRKVNQVIKSGYKISSKCSNSIIMSQGGLSLPLLEERQRSSLINNLITKLATPITRKYIIQTIQCIQKKEAIWFCPICDPEKFDQDNWILYTAKAAKSFKIQICPPNCPLQLENACNSIGLSFKNLSSQLRETAVHTSNALNIKFSNQLLRFNSSIKLSWLQLISHTGIVRCGPEPIWFKNFHNNSNLTGSHRSIPNPNPIFWFLHTMNAIIKTHKRYRLIQENTLLKGRHYTIDPDNNLIKCPGCPLGLSLNNYCSITFLSSNASSLWTINKVSLYAKHRLCNIIEDLANSPTENETFLQSVDILQPIPSPSPLQAIGHCSLFHIQLSKQDLIINETKVTMSNPGLPDGNILRAIFDIIQWCPSHSTIEVRSNKRIIRTPPTFPRKCVKVNFATLTSKIKQISSQKNISIEFTKPKSKPRYTNSIFWNNPSLHFAENPTINKADLGSSSRWCKKIFSITRSYIICESSSITKTFGQSHDTFELQIINSSSKFLKGLQQHL
jgi:hypothetical protein